MIKLEVISVNEDPEMLLEKAERYRRLLKDTDDERTKTAAAALLAELEAKARSPQPDTSAGQVDAAEDAAK